MTRDADVFISDTSREAAARLDMTNWYVSAVPANMT
jgi:hypothetical protein